MRKFVVATAALAFALSATSFAEAKDQCRDPKGKFIKCPAASAPAAKCRDKTSKKFAKCDAPNTEKVPAKK